MNKATELLSAAGTFYIATTEGDQPRVRPFGAVAEFDGKTYICMNNTKKVYKQLIANPKVELTGVFDGGGKWFRLQAVANRDDRLEARAKMLDQAPTLKNMYKPDDGIYEVFYLTDVLGTVESFGGAPETF
ncbi:MAG: pyridoxamine 5'-phosphate oxidase family protein [Oscillospiraceae bacterium]|jgi:uncharacterized pyridoxamine 5'-phosphate oxidase family protein|nr:pyridoxamine 5'-phosphate oxidase family protein [Oscillospiraceae bacterium]